MVAGNIRGYENDVGLPGREGLNENPPLTIAVISHGF